MDATRNSRKSLMTRISGDLHHAIFVCAHNDRVSMNAWCTKALEDAAARAKSQREQMPTATGESEKEA